MKGKESLVLKLFWKRFKFSVLTALSILLAYILETSCVAHIDDRRDMRLIEWRQIQEAPVSEEGAFARTVTHLFQFARLDLLP